MVLQKIQCTAVAYGTSALMSEADYDTLDYPYNLDTLPTGPSFRKHAGTGKSDDILSLEKRK